MANIIIQIHFVLHSPNHLRKLLDLQVESTLVYHYTYGYRTVESALDGFLFGLYEPYLLSVSMTTRFSIWGLPSNWMASVSAGISLEFGFKAGMRHCLYCSEISVGCVSSQV